MRSLLLVASLLMVLARLAHAQVIPFVTLQIKLRCFLQIIWR
jgi:hypothetical protein